MLPAPAQLSVRDLFLGLDRFWPRGRPYPPMAPWMASYYTRDEATALASAIARRLPALFRALRGTTGWDSLQQWLGDGSPDAGAASEAFWRLTLHGLLTSRASQDHPSGLWALESPARQAPGAVVTDDLHETLWWLTPRATFYPQRWLYEVVQQLTDTPWGPPVAWTAPLDDGGQLQLRLWQETGRSPRSADDMAVFDPPACCSAVADLRWTDARGQRQQAVPVASYKGLERLFQLSDVLQTFTEDQQHDIAARLAAVKPPAIVTAPTLVPCAPRSIEHAGMLHAPGAPPPCCDWPVEEAIRYVTAQTLYVSIKGGGDGLSEASPMAFSEARALLRQETTLAPGLVVLFKREEVYDALDLLAHEKEDLGVLLPIRASGAEGYPIRVGAWPDDDTLDAPRFYGDGNGDIDETLQEATLIGLLLEGAQWVQVADLEVTNFKQGVAVVSYPTVDQQPSTVRLASYRPLRGPRDIQLLNLNVHENWNKGIHISSGINELLLPMGFGDYSEDSGQIIIGYDYLGFRPFGGLEADIVEVDIDPEGWWPRAIA